MTRFRATFFAMLGFMLSVPLAGAQAQSAIISGRVTSEFGQPIEGANVFIPTMSISVGTNAEGRYTINIPEARATGQEVILRVRAFGHVPDQRNVRLSAGQQTIDFALRQDVNRLSEVVITGVTAGTEQRNLPFSVARVDEREMPVASANPLTQLQGKVPGMNIVSATGRPGAAPAVILRGPKMINAQGRSQEPLYIVDGVALNGTIADINPQDIESVEVVKGAAASSLYGSRAGAGVIQITTKSGRDASAGIRFNVRAEYGRGDVEREFPLPWNHHLMMDETRRYFCRQGTNCTQIFDFEREALRINEEADITTLAPVGFEREFGVSNPFANIQHGKNVFQVETWPRIYNPIAQIITPGQKLNNTIDASGRFGATSFFTSLNSYFEEGAIRGLEGYRRNSVRLNLDQGVGSDWNFGLRTFFARTRYDGRGADPGGGFFRATRNPRGVNLLRYDKEGRLFVRSNPMFQGDQNFNPLWGFGELAVNEDEDTRFLGTLETRYTPLPWLELSGNFSYDRAALSNFYKTERYTRYNANAFTIPPSLGYIYQWSGSNSSMNTGVGLSANQTFFGDLDTRFTARYLYEQADNWAMDAESRQLATPGLRVLHAGSASRSIGSSSASVRSIGMMAGVDNVYRGRYILGGLVRRDGSSLFGSDARWANYFRVSSAWRVSEEPFWGLSSLSDLKLRASYGTAGGRPSFAAQYETYAVSASGNITPATAGNSLLRPEEVAEFEAGVDMELFRRIGLTYTYAHALAKEQILPVPQPQISGFGTQWQNAGTLENKTHEFSVNLPVIVRQNVNWAVRANYDRTTSIIKELKVPAFLDENTFATNARYRFAEGLPLATWWGRALLRSCDQLPGDFSNRCGVGTQFDFQPNDEGYIVWVGAGNHWSEGITRNLWAAQLPANQGPWSRPLHWGMPILLLDSLGTPQQVDLGSGLPKYRLGFSSTFNYRRFFAYAQADGSFGQRIWNQGRHWSLGDFMTSEVDQASKGLETAKPLGYYYRNPSGTAPGGFYDILGPTNVTVEDGSYMKIREVNLSYNVGSVRNFGDFTVGVTGRNLKTFTNYTGYDPEVGRGGGRLGSAALNAVDAYVFPNLRTYTFTVTTRF
jgi:TonB-linked SusC/RagA family outer membrane protein